MESPDRWSNGLRNLNPKCHYEYQEMRGWLSTLFTHPGFATGMYEINIVLSHDYL